MRVVVIGATGNVGTSVIEALVETPGVEEIAGIARRAPRAGWPDATFAEADVTSDDLVPHLRGADAVIHLAWAIQPSRDRAMTRAINVDGSARVFAAVAEAKVPALVYASSVGAYSPGPKDRSVDESWPTDGIATSFYSTDKAAVERLLDDFEAEHPGVRVVRLRPGLIFKREAATEIRRLFAGPLLPGRLMRPERLPVLPLPAGLRFQAVHSRDVAEAYKLAVCTDAHGAFNVAADPILDGAVLGRQFGARPVEVPTRVVRGLANATWHARLHPTPPGWLDMALAVPIMDTSRAREELGWEPSHTSVRALEDLLEGMRQAAELDTPPLARSSSGPLRSREFTTGVGARAGV